MSFPSHQDTQPNVSVSLCKMMTKRNLWFLPPYEWPCCPFDYCSFQRNPLVKTNLWHAFFLPTTENCNRYMTENSFSFQICATFIFLYTAPWRYTKLCNNKQLLWDVWLNDLLPLWSLFLRFKIKENKSPPQKIKNRANYFNFIHVVKYKGNWNTKCS